MATLFFIASEDLSKVLVRIEPTPLFEDLSALEGGELVGSIEFASVLEVYLKFNDKSLCILAVDDEPKPYRVMVKHHPEKDDEYMIHESILNRPMAT